jgi:hypothetical protein
MENICELCKNQLNFYLLVITLILLTIHKKIKGIHNLIVLKIFKLPQKHNNYN